jgi:hypothetical protein
MMAADMIRLQTALAFAALDVQRRMVSGWWQMALWCLPPTVWGTGPAAEPGRPKRRP